MTTRIRGLSQRARLWDFVASESGAMGAQKAANIGAIMGASAVAGLFMSVADTAHAIACSATIPCSGPTSTWCQDNNLGSCIKAICDTSCQYRCDHIMPDC